MSEPFIAEIRIFAGNFAPRYWAFCSGQFLSIYQNEALFSILGTTYGGDGRTTFALPDLRGRVPVHPGRGPGLTERRLGEKGGESQVTLQQNHLPSHQHTVKATSDAATATDPSNAYYAATDSENAAYTAPSEGTTSAMSERAVSSTGLGGAHNNRQPYLVVGFIISLSGIYPTRY